MASTVGQGLKSRQQQQQAPGPASSGRGDDVSKFSLLGQQFSRYGPAQHRDQPSKSALIGLSPGSRSGRSQFPPISQCHQQPSAVPGHCGNNGGNMASNGQARPFSEPQHQQIPSLQGYNSLYDAHGVGQSNFMESNYSARNSPKACNPQVLLNTLSVLQQKIHQLRPLVQLIAQEGGQSPPNVAQHQEVTTRVASIISQLVVAAAGMFPSSSQQQGPSLSPGNTDFQPDHHFGVAPGLGLNAFQQNEIGNSTIGMANGPVGENTIFGLEGGLGGPNIGGLAASSHSMPPQGSLGSSNPAHALDPSLSGGPGSGKMLGEDADASNCHHANGSANAAGNSFFASRGSGGIVSLDDHDFSGGARDDDDDGDGENLPPGSYELIEMDAVEILAEHTHFCEICGKGFKRDANLRMHMRGHGDEYKTPAALARPEKAQDLAPIQPRRYSCPFLGCKRNKKHKKFQPLKTMLCVKNHYRRSHCPKMFTCNRCKNKKFSVVADLKTHEKHCGRDKWQCSCGTTFSRKDKLFGHITLFQGHTPALPPNENEGPGVTDQRANDGVPHSVGNTASSFASGCGDISGLLAGSASVGASYGNGNVSSIGRGSNGARLDACHGAVRSGGGLKNVNFLEEDNGHAMEGDSSNTMSGFHQAASALMSGPFMFHGLLCNNFLQQNGENQNSNVLQ